ncbi:acyl-CoA thioesterase [Tropicibacter naphthalenivorans]|uniref:4-hydroxybenzoyl-CoA thioesterase n=1 Tax=Tropicibacter naphthalenivorans TaxID=441103 RepID=A0A0P1GJZ2_9RHOB|nr:acyl-CoA thioesterase [Tropicibacter naphthalenivorans]CUH82275.1 4-hydroxybenzoyl-CoA thioesterase [Tropicibacter naphthalenivorans]SMD04650.1 4-hydroxybenzoyl-CoA thioesterase [Tropicibacter naphthalenivorans]
MSIFTRDQSVTFGDCDPAGIVYYPNYYRWMDGTFHEYLRAVSSGHSGVCAQLGARGLGLMESKLAFRSPAVDGTVLRYAIEGITWANKSFDITYTAHDGDRLVLEGMERRGIFIEKDGRLRAGETAPLRALLGL